MRSMLAFLDGLTEMDLAARALWAETATERDTAFRELRAIVVERRRGVDDVVAFVRETIDRAARDGH